MKISYNDDQPVESPTSPLPIAMCPGLVLSGAWPELKNAQSPGAVGRWKALLTETPPSKGGIFKGRGRIKEQNVSPGHVSG